MSRAVVEFTEAIIKFGGRQLSVAEFNSFQRIISSLAVSGSDGVLSLFKTVNYTLNDATQLVTVNDIPLRLAAADIKVGNIRKALSTLNIPNNITTLQEQSYKQLLPDISAITYVEDSERLYQSVRRVHSDLDIDGGVSNAIDVASLPASTKIKAQSFMRRIKQAAGSAVAVSFVVLTGDLLIQLELARRRRRNCYVISNKGKTVCTLNQRFCVNGNTTNTSTDHVSPCSSAITDLLPKINPYMYYHHKITDPTKMPPTSNTEENTRLLTDYYKDTTAEALTIDCGLVGPTYTGCVACDSSVNVWDPNYLDTARLPTNMTVRCVTNSTLLETLVDLSLAVGADIFNTTTDTLFSSIDFKLLGKYGLVILSILAVVFSVFAYFRYNSNKGMINRGVNYSYVPETITDTNNV